MDIHLLSAKITLSTRFGIQFRYFFIDVFMIVFLNWCVIWGFCQAFSSSLTGALSTKAVLESIGVGDSTSTSLGATLSWLIKDGTGMVGRILFAWLKGYLVVFILPPVMYLSQRHLFAGLNWMLTAKNGDYLQISSMMVQYALNYVHLTLDSSFMNPRSSLQLFSLLLVLRNLLSE